MTVAVLSFSPSVGRLLPASDFFLSMYSPLICTSLVGGLGNQLFQYAAGRQLARRYGTELLFDDTQLKTQRTGTTVRQLELLNFKVFARPATSAELSGLWFARRLPLISRMFTPWCVLVEKSGGYDTRFDQVCTSTYLVGYWQCYKYFSEAASSIADELNPVAQLSPTNSALTFTIDRSESVAVHIRRGDYVSLKSAAKFHGALSLNYYASAIVAMKSTLPNARFFIFSDDQQWCRNNLPLHGIDAEFVSSIPDSGAWEDLVLMARCRHHIIANSSFSWWGAWLADQRFGTRRRVIAPTKWFVNSQLATHDRFPPHWELL